MRLLEETYRGLAQSLLPEEKQRFLLESTPGIAVIADLLDLDLLNLDLLDLDAVGMCAWRCVNDLVFVPWGFYTFGFCSVGGLRT
jgi:hypothetical protein